MTAPTNTEGTVAKLYNAYITPRDPFLRRARQAATLTVPSLMPPENHSGSTLLPTPFQSLGSRGLTNLAAKLLLAILPPDDPLTKLVPEWSKMPEIASDKDIRSQVEQALASIELAVKDEVETAAMRVPALELLKQLLLAGNVLAYLPPTGGLRVFRLDRYVVKRDPGGRVLEIIVRESMHPTTIPAEACVSCGVDANTAAPDKSVDVYTYVKRESAHWVVSQEINGKTVPGSDGTYPLDATPWLALRFTAIDNEDYGRGFIEEHIGDLISLEALTQAIVEGAAAAAKVLFLVNPNGTTNRKSVAEAPNGKVLPGNAADVSVLRMDKFADFRVALDTIRDLTERLAFSFMLQSAAQRDGERVTKAEIMYVASELDDGLSGIYSILAQELQLPLVRRIMLQLEKRGSIPVLPRGAAKPTIVTGLAALGRNSELRRLDEAIGRVLRVLGEATWEFINPELYIEKVDIGTGSKLREIMFTPEEREENSRQRQMQQAAQLALPNATKGMFDNINQRQAAELAAAQ